MTSLQHGGEQSPQQTGSILVMPTPQGKLSRWEVWRNRLLLLVFVLFCLEIGIILTVAPWTSFWPNNSLLIGFPRLREVLMQDFVRGLISGLGLSDIWLAISEAVRYREPGD